MTHRIILEATAGEHLRQKLAAMDDLLGVLIVLERVLPTSSGWPRSSNSELYKCVSPGLHIIQLVPEQLEPAVVRVRRCRR